MRLLLDTHALFWAVIDADLLSENARAAIRAEDSEVFVSVATAWEIAIKVGLGRWPEAAPLIATFEHEVAMAGFRHLPISVSHVRAAGLMQTSHRDPFDRLLIAQSRIEGLTLVTAYTAVQMLGTPWLW